ncbi:hypothetical protein H072_4775 [Dactylellina haptotyla CBS 200.50]|uniref:Uncharacterized protein n=1 Tax=Dactylellina haptotyla (strain CBS 200.50) TaxID=1284197 RepID=S8AEL9_DACHA|nr:hypothetical protein H072_4775 [Dactylellina haptotyla CBS 200.50]
MVCTLAFERQQRSTTFWEGLRPRRPMLALSDFTRYLDDQSWIWPLENIPKDEEGFEVQSGLTLWERIDHEKDRYRKFEFTLHRLAGWLLRAHAYPEKDPVLGSVTGIVEVWKMPKLEHIPEILKHPRITYRLIGQEEIDCVLLKSEEKPEV